MIIKKTPLGHYEITYKEYKVTIRPIEGMDIEHFAKANMLALMKADLDNVKVEIK